MNKYLRGLIHVPCGAIKVCINKLIHGSRFQASLVCAMSPLTEITVDQGGRLSLGRKFRMRDGAKIRVRKGAECVIGENVSLNSDNMVACREKVVIGDGVMLSPNVQIYDHDHDFRSEGGIWDKTYKTTPVIIGKNCWIGANTVVLRGTVLGDNCVVGAGTVLKGEYPAGSIIVQKRETTVKLIGQWGIYGKKVCFF